MTVENRLISLQQKHAKIEAKLEKLEHMPSRDEQKIHELKKEKLGLKEEIERMQLQDKVV